MDARAMILRTPMIDWITLTTFNEDTLRRWRSAILERLPTDGEQERRLQYTGARLGSSTFIGGGEQKHRDHWMVQSSGEEADAVARWLSSKGPKNDPGRVTRLDLQVTVPVDAFPGRAIADLIKPWDMEGRPRRVQLIESPDGSTVYVGSRQSERFIRIYEKRDEGDNVYARFEVEYHGPVAVEVWKTLRESDFSTIGKIIKGEMMAIPPFPTRADFLQALKNFPGIRVNPTRVYTNGPTLDWLRRQVDAALVRAMRDHDTGEQVRNLVYAWAAEAEKIDNAEGRGSM